MKKSAKVATLNAKTSTTTPKEAVETKTKDLVREKAKEKKPKTDEAHPKEEKTKRARIYRKVDYNATPKQQKNQRNKVRHGLFAIINPYLAQKRAGTLKPETAKETFEKFKDYAKEEYTLPISQAEEFFKGSEEGQQALKTFLPDFRAYLEKQK